MIAIVLCAGFATRLDPLTRETPTALLDVAGKPVLDYVLPQLLDLPGLDALHLVSNARFAARFYQWWEERRRDLEGRGLDFFLHNDGSLDETRRLGEVGDLAYVLHRLARPEVGAVVMSGDTIYRFSLRPIWERFRASAAHYVLAVPESHPQVLQQTSVVDFDEDGRVRHLYRHPESPPTKWACPPLYFLRRSGLDRIQDYLAAAGDRDTLDLFVDYLAGQEPVYALPVQGRDLRLRINTRYTYDRARDLLSREPVMVDA